MPIYTCPWVRAPASRHVLTAVYCCVMPEPSPALVTLRLHSFILTTGLNLVLSKDSAWGICSTCFGRTLADIKLLSQVGRK